MEQEMPQNQKSKISWKCVGLFALGVIGFSLLFEMNIKPRESIWALLNLGKNNTVESSKQSDVPLEEQVLPSQGVLLPISWNDLGKQMVEAGVIDSGKLEKLYAQRGGLNESEQQLLGTENTEITMTSDNASFLLNLFWAFGLANKNEILEQGPMVDLKYGGAQNFASTAGWTLSSGNPMEHYSRHAFVALTSEQQKLVENVSKNIFRPCCGNSTYFPDCNHGMAMLGLLELMAAHGSSEQEMYKVALRVNSYWFPDTYLTLAAYFKDKKGISWDKVDAKEVLGPAYSSAMGYRQILEEVNPPQNKNGGSCGV